MKNNCEKFIVFFLLLQPFLDVLSVVFPKLYMHVLVRGLFLVYVVFYLFKSSKYKKEVIFLCLSMIPFFVYHYMFLKFPLFSVLNSIFKLYYLFFIILFFSSKKINNIGKYLSIILVEYIIIYLCSYIFKFGYSAYLTTDGKTGFRGMFQSINEISAILVILYYFILHYFKDKNIIVGIFTLLLFFIAYLTGTKVLFGFLSILFLGFIIIKLLPYWKKFSWKKRSVSVLGIVCFLLIVFYIFINTSVYKNMLIQADFFKVNNFFTFDGINYIIFNNRITFLNLNWLNFMQENIFSWIFGIGYFNSLKLSELDCFDILFRFGIGGFSLFIWMMVFLFRKINRNKWNILGAILLLIISTTSGHVLLSPAVSIYFGILLCFPKEV